MKNRILISIIVGVLFCGYFFAGNTLAAFTGVGDVSASDDGVVIAEAGKYKDLDYSFLRTFNYGDEAADKVILTYDSINELKNSTDVRIKEGRYIATKGYHSVGDKGGACYVISATRSSYGSVELTNGLYANIINDTYSYAGNKWAVISVKQYGAYADGVTEDQSYINDAIKAANEAVGKNGVTRAVVYIPAGEYKVTDQIHISGSKINIIGEGDKSIIFTDNDYRKASDYYEFFIMIQEANDMFLSSFKIEAREVDIYKYMRQVILSDCSNIYIHKMTMIVPQEAWSGFYYEDKQYTNLTLYSGNKNITVDGCYMEQMSGTYRGANLGILDFWQRGEENITIMNCEFHDNARDEQIGIFSLSGSTSSFVKNVDFINNTIYSYKPPYRQLYGNRQMCFTVAYADSPNVSDIRIAGNHFISEVDSKLMTFGKLTECVVENNIIEVYSSYGVFGMVFDSSNNNPENILIRNNEFYLSGRDDSSQGKAAMSTGHLTFKDNRIVADASIYALAGKYGIYSGNKVIGITGLGSIGNPLQYLNNEIIAYRGLDMLLNLAGDNESGKSYICNGNSIINYGYKNENNSNPFAAINKVTDVTCDMVSFANNTLVCPNYRYLPDSRNNPYNAILYFKQNTGLVKNVVVNNNSLQGAKGIITWGDVSTSSVTESGNTYKEFTYDGHSISEEQIKIKYNGNEVTEITAYGDAVNLSAVTTKDIEWVSAIEAIATVSNGIVKRQSYGTVRIYALPKDGVSEPVSCLVHFVKQKATGIDVDSTSINMQPGYVYDVPYKVLPYEDAGQKLLWTSSNESVATVDDFGVITAVATGNATITCKTTDGSNLSKNIVVKVEAVSVKKINLNYSYKYFETKGGTLKLVVDSYYPNEAINKSVGKWESTDTSVATVDSTGLVTIKGCGVAVIRAYTTDLKYYGTCEIYVKPNAINGLQTTDVGMNNVALKWEAVENAYGYNVYRYNTSSGKWDIVKKTTDTSYNDTSLSKNTSYKYCVKAYIARWDSSGRTEYVGNDSNIVNVKTYSFQPVNGINLMIDRLSVGVVDTVKVNAKVYPLNATNKELVWSVQDTSIASVEYENAGTTLTVKVKGIKEGVTTLTAKAKDDAGYSITIPLVVVDIERPKAAELTPKYKDIVVKWEAIADESDIDGYVVYRTGSIEYSPVKYISKAELKISTNESGKKCYVYTDTGLEQNVNYGYKIAGYIKYEGYQYAGEMSYEKRAKLLPYTNVDSITSDEEYVISIGETKKIYAMVDNLKGMIPDFIWQIDDISIATVTPLASENTSNKGYASIKGVSAGITRLNIIANDDTGYFIMPKLVVLPDKVTGITSTTTANSANISWNQVKGASGYMVYVYEENSDTYLHKEKVAGTNININELAVSTTYKYAVCAYIEDNESVYEGARSVTKMLTTKTDIPEVYKEKETTKSDDETEKTTTNKVDIDASETTVVDETTTGETTTGETIREDETTSLDYIISGTEGNEETSANNKPFDDETETDDTMGNKDKSSVIWWVILFIATVCGGTGVYIKKRKR